MSTWNSNKTFRRIIYSKKVTQCQVFLPIIFSSKMTLRAGLQLFWVSFGVDIVPSCTCTPTTPQTLHSPIKWEGEGSFPGHQLSALSKRQHNDFEHLGTIYQTTRCHTERAD